MRYMLMMNAPRGAGDWQINNWTPDEFKAHIAFMHRYNTELTDAGEMVDAQGLSMPGEAKLVRAGKDGTPVTDGVFPGAQWPVVTATSPPRRMRCRKRSSPQRGSGPSPESPAIRVGGSFRLRRGA